MLPWKWVEPIVTWLILSGTINYLQIFLVCGHESYRRWGKLFLGYNILSAVHWHIWDSLPPRIIEDFIKIRATDYGHPMKPFFHWNTELLGLGRQIGQINSGAFWVLSAKLSAPILVQWVPCPCFPLFNHYFYKKLSLYINIHNIYLGLRFELGPQRIRNLAFVCP